MTRDERESLLEELHDVDRIRGELLGMIACAVNRVGRGRPGTDAYAELASILIDTANDFYGAPEFASMRRRLEEDEQSQADQKMGQQRRAYFGGVL